MKKILIIMLSLLCACAVSRVNKNAEDNKPAANSFLYLTYRISRDTVTRATHIELKNKSKIAGSVKSTGESYTSKNFLECTFVDKNNKVVSTQKLDHPLFYRAETLNDNRQLETKSVELNDSEFVLRVNKTAGIDKLIINENLDNKSPVKIFELEIRN
ncbi:MAG: hypothetical protein IPF54_25865 [Draconibacterium sp.]|nr:hypothetical protein [Draconibacterium sp.]